MIVRPNEPTFSQEKHLDAQSLEEQLSVYQSSNTGRLALIVLRCDDGSRVTPNEVQVSIDRGVHGDRWERDPKREREEQIAVMDVGLAKIFANGQTLTLFGDNLFMEQDWSLWNPGDCFILGSAQFILTQEPHTGCAKFSRRFGNAALKKTAQEPKKKRRGVYIRVVRPGKICVGDILKRIDS